MCLFQLYDHDKDGILNFKEIQKVLKCLGLRLNEEQVEIFYLKSRVKHSAPSVKAKSFIRKVSADKYGFSVSFNEYLRLVSLYKRRDPDEECLLDIFR